MEWVLSLVNGRIFCPSYMAGTQPRLHCDNNGQTNVHDFLQVFQDTGEEDLLLELFQNLEICIRFGEQQQNLVIPSLMTTSPPTGCWTPDTNNSSVVYFGLCMKCHQHVGFSPSFFPRLQIRLYNMWLLNYPDLEVPLWQGGFKLMQALPSTQRTVEAVIALADDSFDTHIVVRSHKNDTAAALALREVIVQQIYEVADEVSQGSQVDRQVLANRSISQFSVEEKASLVHFSVPELRQACAERRPPQPAGAAIVEAMTRDDATDHLAPIDSVRYLRATGRLPAFLLDQQTMDVIDETVGEDWARLAGELDFSSQEVSDLKRQSQRSSEGACLMVLHRWQGRPTADFPQLITALQACCFNQCVEAVEACMERQRRFQPMMVRGTLPRPQEEI